MEKLPLVSVIIPVYNMEQYLNETIDSILASDYPQLEVIVMNDGSKDNSLQIAQSYAEKDTRVKVYSSENKGVCEARNFAISKATSELIFPMDADNMLTPDFFRIAVPILLSNKDVKAVIPRADFFGDRTGEWKLPPFSLKLLARKSIIDTCALYRKEDWVRTGGYCKEIIAREDWEFWISVLKDGGKVVKTDEICLHYRIRNRSKRVSDRSLKKHVVKVLNKRHPEFFERELGGPLRYQRTWSRLYNKVYRFFHPRKVFVHEDFKDFKDFIKVLPVHFKNNEGKVIHSGRNELREFQYKGKELVVKSYCKPNFINQIAYGLLRSSKAQRSYEYAEMLLKMGIGSPQPVGYITERSGLLFKRSYFVCMKSECPYIYTDLVKNHFEHEKEILEAIAHTTAQLHENGWIHKDYSRGNILFRETPDGVKVEIIDLNRMRFRKISMEEGCKNFDRLPGNEAWWKIMSDVYAKDRGFDADECYKLICKYSAESTMNKL